MSCTPAVAGSKSCATLTPAPSSLSPSQCAWAWLPAALTTITPLFAAAARAS
ncbi:hypothetical protein [Lysobacter gummosus]|uniref:hypothetical protein n=1 Tax=Lysobacter gummosus TaxID=262324 RepID=UPI003644321E